jgi:hypothetical protein
MRFYLSLIATLFVAAAVPAVAQTTPAVGRVVTLSDGDMARLGLRIAPVTPAAYTPRVHGYGVVLDLGALATADAGVATAEAAARQSAADLGRARALYAQGGAISKQALDAAQKQATADATSVLLARRQEVVQFGPQLPWRGAGGKASILGELTSGRAILVRATFPLDTIDAAQPPEISVTHLGTGQNDVRWTTNRIWSAPADPTIPGRAFFALISGSNLQSGEHVLAYAPTGAATQGWLIPTDAMVLNDEKAWCYLQIAPGRFQRLQIDPELTLPGGYFTPSPLARGRAVVVQGTGLLLAREIGAAMQLRY